MGKYSLVNPYIQGDIETTFRAESSSDAAKKAWNTLSKYINNNVPQFGFTIKNLDDNSLQHYVVKEKITEEDYADFKIIKADIKLKKKQENAFLKSVENIQNKPMFGGKRNKRYLSDYDEDDEDWEDKDFYDNLRYQKYVHQPINYVWYDPYIYSNYADALFLPTFTHLITPYLQIEMNSAFFV